MNCPRTTPELSLLLSHLRWDKTSPPFRGGDLGVVIFPQQNNAGPANGGGPDRTRFLLPRGRCHAVTECVIYTAYRKIEISEQSHPPLLHSTLFKEGENNPLLPKQGSKAKSCSRGSPSQPDWILRCAQNDKQGLQRSSSHSSSKLLTKIHLLFKMDR